MASSVTVRGQRAILRQCRALAGQRTDFRGWRQRIPEDQRGMSEGSVRGSTDEVRAGSHSVETGSIRK